MSDGSVKMVGLGVLLAAIVLGSFVRIQKAFSLPSFDATRVERMIKSDPALLYYITQRIVESGGRPPHDFRADPRIEHPEKTDIPAMFTVGQEFLIAWSYRIFGAGMPLHVFCVIAMGIFASLCAVGVYGLALETTGKVPWAGFASLLYAITPANYRTIGFILVREDFSLPFFALHLWLLARAARLRTRVSFALAALALAAALATWHAMGSVVAIEAVCIFAWFLRSGRNPLSVPGSWIFPAVLAAAGLLVPVLRAKLFVLSPPMQIALALLAAAFGRRWGSRAPAWVALGAWGAAFAVSLGLTRLLAGGPGDYAHVWELVWSKLRTLGVPPADPAQLPFGARLLWQGPFGTGSPARLLAALYAAGALLAVAVLGAVPGWLRGRGDPRVLVLMAFAAASVAVGLAVHRMMVLSGLLAPVAVAVLLRGVRPAAAATWMIGLSLLQSALFTSRIDDTALSRWYDRQKMSELAAAVEWIRDRLPPEGAIAADFVTSTAILAHTGHPVVLQPKYETRRSRERIERFLTTFYRGSPADLHRLLRRELDSRYLLVDVTLLWGLRYAAGLPYGAPAPPEGSAAAALMAVDPGGYRGVPGFRLRYTSAGTPPLLRLYELERPGD